MRPVLERRLALGAVAAGGVLLLVSVESRWTTVPGRLLPAGRDVDLPGSVLYEIGRLYALLTAAALVALLRSGGTRLQVAGALTALVGLLALAQALDAALDPAKWVVVSDEGLERVGLGDAGGRSAATDLLTADLPAGPWAFAAVLATVLVLAGGLLSALRGRRWEQTSLPPDRERESR